MLLIGHTQPLLCQTPNNQKEQVKTAATTFYREYLKDFSYPFGQNANKLDKYLSPRLNALLRYELRRMAAWEKKNPGDKPPVVDDLFTCNHYDKPQKFQVLSVEHVGSGSEAVVEFQYIEGDKVIDRCNATAVFVWQAGKWLLDNVKLSGGSDLKKLLSRKDYTVLPE